MKRKLFIFLLFVWFAMCGCSPTVKNIDSAGKTIVCLGDSIAAGFGVGQARAFPTLLAAVTNQPVVNAGVSGDTTALALERVRHDVLSNDPYLVVIELGGNDFLRRIPKAETLRNLKEIIDAIHEQGAAVALCDMSSGMVMAGYSYDLQKLAEKTGSIFIPGVMEGILDNALRKSDFIHPDKQGHQLIAQRIFEGLSQYYEF